MTTSLGPGIDAVVFDLDGTLIDSERAICAASSAAFAEIGIVVDELSIADHLGAPLEELYGLFAHDDDEARRRTFIQRYIEIHDEHPEANPPALPGVVEGLDALRALGLPLAVATTKPTARAQQQLQAIGLHAAFAHIQGTDPPMKPKPAPDVVVRAAAGLGVDPARVWMVGDTPRDVGAARACGAKAAVIAYSAVRLTQAHTMGADLVLSSVVELLRR